MDSITSAINHWADTNPDAVVFTFVNKLGLYAEYTPRMIRDCAGRFASRLRRFGFVENDVIANSLPNSPERLITDLGIIMAGCVMVNAQVSQTDGADFFIIANNARCKCVILPKKSDNSSYKLFEPWLGVNGQECTEVSLTQAPTLTKLLLYSRDQGHETNLLQAVTEGQDYIYSYSQASPTDLAVLFITSGTSGFSKLVPRTHQEILLCARSFQGGKNAKYFSDRPFGWMGGFPFDFLAYCSHRILQDKFSNDYADTSRELWDVISRSRCTGAAILPLTLLELIQVFTHSKKPDFRIPFIVTGGQPISQKLAPMIGLLCDALVVSYSSTECAMVSVGMVTTAEQLQDNFSGKLGQNIECKIVDDNGLPLEANQTGNILLKSPYMLINYYPPVPSSTIFTADGYFKTGDRGMMDNSGNLYSYGRAGDVISQGVYLVYTSWPEQVLSKCPHVADVVVIGVMDKDSGQDRLYACVVPKPGSTVTKEFLLEYYSSRFMDTDTRETFKPELADVFLFERFPETFTGKVNKLQLKALVVQKLNLHSTN